MNRLSKFALALVPGVLALTSCAALFPSPAPQVTGQLLDPDPAVEPNWSVPTFGAVVGFGAADDVDYDNQPQIVDELITGGYTIELPLTATEGVYEVIGFEDSNGDGDLDDGERLGGSAPKYFVYSRDGGDVNVFGTTVTVPQGWSMVQGSTVTAAQANTFGNVDLTLD